MDQSMTDIFQHREDQESLQIVKVSRNICTACVTINKFIV